MLPLRSAQGQHDGSGLLRPSGARNDVVTRRLSQFLAAATFVLLFAGGLVTTTDSGLTVPDWPLSYGSLFPPMAGGIRFEHTHRLIASGVGLLTLILTLWIGKTESRPGIRWLAIASLGAVVLQGILGGLTVLYQLPTAISVAHACLGPIFFCLVVALSESISPRKRGQAPFEKKRPAPFFWLSAAVVFFIFLQILLGAVVRHTGSGIGFHLASALILFILSGLLVTQTLNHFSQGRQILRPALFLGFLVTAEFFLGIGAFVFTRIGTLRAGLGAILFPTLHQTVGSLTLAAAVALAIRTLRGVQPARHCEPPEAAKQSQVQGLLRPATQVSQ